jgi:hypothetical protein
MARDGDQRNLWALWGVAAGALGVVTNVVLDDQTSHLKSLQPWGANVIGELDRSLYQVGVVTGFATIACLALFVAGWRRWAEPRTASVASGAVTVVLTISAGAMLVGYGVKGGLAEYLPGGSNADNFSSDALLVLFTLNDTAGWYAWWGVVIAAGCCAWLGLRDRVLPIWLGVLGVLAVLPPLVAMVATGAVAVAGVVGPLWMIVLGVALVLERDAQTSNDSQHAVAATGRAD